MSSMTLRIRSLCNRKTVKRGGKPPLLSRYMTSFAIMREQPEKNISLSLQGFGLLRRIGYVTTQSTQYMEELTMNMITIAAGVVLSLTLGLTQLSGSPVRANTPSETSRTNVCTNRFVDTDSNGICDNRGNGDNFVDNDGDGVCDNRDNCDNFIDNDRNGVCDNRGNGGNRGNHGKRGNGGSCGNRGNRGNGRDHCCGGSNCR